MTVKLPCWGDQLLAVQLTLADLAVYEDEERVQPGKNFLPH